MRMRGSFIRINSCYAGTGRAASYVGSLSFVVEHWPEGHWEVPADEVVKAKDLGHRLIALASFVKTKGKGRQPGNEDLQPDLPNGETSGAARGPLT